MASLFVYADFDWLPAPELIGRLSCETVGGREIYGFKFDDYWLRKHGAIFLSDDMQNFSGMQYAMADRDIFSCFSDALPDRWGRTLLNRREQIVANDEKRSPRRLTSFDYLIGVEDYTRMGAFRFADTVDGPFLNVNDDMKVPPLSTVRELMYAAHEIEKSEEKQVLPAGKWILQLLRPGTSLGGARPKASVLDDDRSLTMAKFPSRKDDYDVALWEHFSHIMARKAGVSAAQTKVIPGGDFHILLSKRFDRTADGRRIHFASALTLLGLTDGDNASSGYGYTDIVDFIVGHGADVGRNLEELYRRVAFNIIIGNSDDHFRNHGFLLTKKGWELSPAYDLNPTLDQHQSLLINRATSEADLNILLVSSDEYMIPHTRAEIIISEVKTAMKSWHSQASALGISKRDIDKFAPRFERWL